MQQIPIIQTDDANYTFCVVSCQMNERLTAGSFNHRALCKNTSTSSYFFFSLDLYNHENIVNSFSFILVSFDLPSILSITRMAIEIDWTSLLFKFLNE